MKLLKFFGESDDRFLADIEGEPLRQIDCYRSLVAKFLLTAADGKLLVTGHFLSGGYGIWSIGVALADEGEILPSWSMEYQIAPCRVPELYTSANPWRPYSPMLVIQAPDDVVVVDADSVHYASEEREQQRRAIFPTLRSEIYR